MEQTKKICLHVEFKSMIFVKYSDNNNCKLESNCYFILKTIFIFFFLIIQKYLIKL